MRGRIGRIRRGGPVGPPFFCPRSADDTDPALFTDRAKVYKCRDALGGTPWGVSEAALPS